MDLKGTMTEDRDSGGSGAQLPRGMWRAEDERLDWMGYGEQAKPKS